MTILASQDCQQFSANLFNISSLCGPFFFSARPLKGCSSLPPLISSQPHRSQAFPTQRSLYSHKDPRNPAACPQLIFPVAILLTQPPTGRGCKWRAGNRPLCVSTPASPPPTSSAVEWPECQSPVGVGGWVGVQPTAHSQHQGLFLKKPRLPSAHLLIKQSDASSPVHSGAPLLFLLYLPLFLSL